MTARREAVARTGRRGGGPGACWARVAAATLLVAGLVACAPTTSEPVPTQTAGVTDHVRIGLTEWAVVLGPVSASAGDVTLEITNTGGTRHDLVVHGELGSWRTPMLQPGASTELEVQTVAGEVLALDCSVPGHHEQGMYAELAVSDRSPSP